jgi:hypothetical protein
MGEFQEKITVGLQTKRTYKKQQEEQKSTSTTTKM